MSRQAINVSLKDFLLTGILNPIKFGMTSNELKDILGEPDTVWTKRKSRRPTGFEYGEIEFYFTDSNDNRLCTIYLDHFDIPKGNEALNLDAWWIRGGLSRPDVEKALTEAGITFSPTQVADPTMEGIITSSGVVLGFTKPEEPFPGLYNICRDWREQFEPAS
jgi:hypothetical protein